MEKSTKLALYYEETGERRWRDRRGEEDVARAKQCFRLAARYGEGEVRWSALCNLALLTKDPEAKMALYGEAAGQGCAHALNMMGICAERYGDEDRSALEWFREAARAGSPHGMYNCALRTSSWNEKVRMLTRAVEEYGHEPSRILLEKVRQEKLRQDNRQERLRQERDLELLMEFLAMAVHWEGQPLAAVCLTDIPLGDQNGLAFDAAQELGKPVILLCGTRTDSITALPCVGYDPCGAGLRKAMDTVYNVRDCWGLGGFTISAIRKKDMDAYCKAVAAALGGPKNGAVSPP